VHTSFGLGHVPPQTPLASTPQPHAQPAELRKHTSAGFGQGPAQAPPTGEQPGIVVVVVVVVVLVVVVLVVGKAPFTAGVHSMNAWKWKPFPMPLTPRVPNWSVTSWEIEGPGGQDIR